MAHWLDNLSRSVADGSLTRRALLRRVGAGALAGAAAAVGRRAATLEAQVAAGSRCLISSAPNTATGCPSGQICATTGSNQGICCPVGMVSGGGGTTCVCPPGHRLINGACFATCSGPLQCGATGTCGCPGGCHPTNEGVAICGAPIACHVAKLCTSTSQCPTGYACELTCCGPDPICVPPCGTTTAATTSVSGPTSNRR